MINNNIANYLSPVLAYEIIDYSENAIVDIDFLDKKGKKELDKYKLLLGNLVCYIYRNFYSKSPYNK